MIPITEEDVKERIAKALEKYECDLDMKLTVREKIHFVCAYTLGYRACGNDIFEIDNQK